MLAKRRYGGAWPRIFLLSATSIVLAISSTVLILGPDSRGFVAITAIVAVLAQLAVTAAAIRFHLVDARDRHRSQR